MICCCLSALFVICRRSRERRDILICQGLGTTSSVITARFETTSTADCKPSCSICLDLYARFLRSKSSNDKHVDLAMNELICQWSENWPMNVHWQTNDVDWPMLVIGQWTGTLPIVMPYRANPSNPRFRCPAIFALLPAKLLDHLPVCHKPRDSVSEIRTAEPVNSVSSPPSFAAGNHPSPRVATGIAVTPANKPSVHPIVPHPAFWTIDPAQTGPSRSPDAKAML